MAATAVTVHTQAGPVQLTVHSVEEYITGLAQTSTKPSNDPYTDWSTGRARTLSQAQLRSAMAALGYSKTQIRNVMAGNVGGGGSWISDALQGLAGGLAAVGPAGSGLGDALDALAPAAGDTAAAIEDAAPAAENVAKDATSGAPSSSLPLLTKLLPSGLQNSQDLLLVPLIAWLMTEKNWVRVLEFIGGAAMIGIAMRELANS